MGLSNSKGACLGKSDVSPSKKGRSNASDFKVFDIVSTVYGVGFVLEVRSTDYVVKLMNWKLAQGQSPTLYLAKASMTKVLGVKVGSYAKTVYGLSLIHI